MGAAIIPIMVIPTDAKIVFGTRRINAPNNTPPSNIPAPKAESTNPIPCAPWLKKRCKNGTQITLKAPIPNCATVSITITPNVLLFVSRYTIPSLRSVRTTCILPEAGNALDVVCGTEIVTTARAEAK